MLKNTSGMDHQMMLLLGTLGVGTVLTWLATRNLLASNPKTLDSNGPDLNEKTSLSTEANDPRNFVKLMNDQVSTPFLALVQTPLRNGVEKRLSIENVSFLTFISFLS
jgi:hypothetical protein